MEPQRLADIITACLDSAIAAGPDISDLKSVAFDFGDDGATVTTTTADGTPTAHTVSAAELADALDEDIETAPAEEPAADAAEKD